MTTTKPYSAPHYINLEVLSDGPLCYADDLSFFDYYPPKNIKNLERRLEIAFCLGMTQLVAGAELAIGSFKWMAVKLSCGCLGRRSTTRIESALARSGKNFVIATKEHIENLRLRHPFEPERAVPSLAEETSDKKSHDGKNMLTSLVECIIMP